MIRECIPAVLCVLVFIVQTAMGEFEKISEKNLLLSTFSKKNQTFSSLRTHYARTQSFYIPPRPAQQDEPVLINLVPVDQD